MRVVVSPLYRPQAGYALFESAARARSNNLWLAQMILWFAATRVFRICILPPSFPVRGLIWTILPGNGSPTKIQTFEQADGMVTAFRRLVWSFAHRRRPVKAARPFVTQTPRQYLTCITVIVFTRLILSLANRKRSSSQHGHLINYRPREYMQYHTDCCWAIGLVTS